jgi:hypothetical protein
MAGADDSNPLKAASQGIRDAAKYLIAVFGAIGGVLVGGLSLTALPSGAHPFVAAIAVGVAVLALAFLVGLGLAIITPEAITLGGLAKIEREEPGSAVIARLKADDALFMGQGPDLDAFHKNYVDALGERASKQDTYLRTLTTEDETASKVASARAEFLTEAVTRVLQVAVFYQLQTRFSPLRRALMIALALVVVAAAGVFAWASHKPASSKNDASATPYSQERVWLEHLIATSGFRIERLQRESEIGSSVAAVRRAGRALTLQTRVQRHERDALHALIAEGAGD